MEAHKDDYDQGCRDDVIALKQRRMCSEKIDTRNNQFFKSIKSAKQIIYHIPDKIGQPVKIWLYSTDELHMLGLVHTFLNEKDDKASRNK